MIELLERLFSYYPDTYTLSDFTYAFSADNPAFAATLAVTALTFAIGFLEYIWSFRLVRAEASAPYPLMMHCFYFGIDSMGIVVFALASYHTGGFWVFTAASIAEVVWTLFEIYNLVKCVTLERDAIWGNLYPEGVPVFQAVWRIVAQCLAWIFIINTFRVFLVDPAMFKWYIFTNVLMAIVPGLYWERRKTRTGASMVLAVIILVGTVNSFLPTNMWASVSSYFSMVNNPWFYLMGVVSIFFAVRGVVVLARLPKKDAVCEATGRKTLL